MGIKLKEQIIERMKNAYGDNFEIFIYNPLRSGCGAQLTCNADTDEPIGVYASTNFFKTKIKEMKDDYIFCTRNAEICKRVEEIIKPFFTSDVKVTFTPMTMFNTEDGVYNSKLSTDQILNKLDEWDEFIIVTRTKVEYKDMENLAIELDRQGLKFGLEILALANDDVYEQADKDYFDKHETSEVTGQYCDIQLDNNKHKIISTVDVF